MFNYPDAAHDPLACVKVVVVLRRSRICAATLRRTSDRVPLQAFSKPPAEPRLGGRHFGAERRIPTSVGTSLYIGRDRASFDDVLISGLAICLSLPAHLTKAARQSWGWVKSRGHRFACHLRLVEQMHFPAARHEITSTCISCPMSTLQLFCIQLRPFNGSVS